MKNKTKNILLPVILIVIIVVEVIVGIVIITTKRTQPEPVVSSLDVTVPTGDVYSPFDRLSTLEPPSFDFGEYTFTGSATEMLDFYKSYTAFSTHFVDATKDDWALYQAAAYHITAEIFTNSPAIKNAKEVASIAFGASQEQISNNLGIYTANVTAKYSDIHAIAAKYQTTDSTTIALPAFVAFSSGNQTYNALISTAFLNEDSQNQEALLSVYFGSQIIKQLPKQDMYVYILEPGTQNVLTSFTIPNISLFATEYERTLNDIYWE